jgi:hypothetical protein
VRYTALRQLRRLTGALRKRGTSVPAAAGGQGADSVTYDTVRANITQYGALQRLDATYRAEVAQFIVRTSADYRARRNELLASGVMA